MSQREIKFRAWNGKEFVNVNRLTLDDLENNQLLDFQQYTGLKDENGKEIYEGDIVKMGKYISEIISYKTGFEIEKRYLGARLWESAKNIEVIGNVYENPELLK